MPAPVVYVVGVTAVIAGAATAYVVKQHVWDPHVKPKFDKWVLDMKAKAQARRQRRRAGGRSVAVPIFSQPGDSPNHEISVFPGPPVEMQTVVDSASAHTTATDTNITARSRSQRNVFDTPNISISTEPLVPSPVRVASPPRSPFVVSEHFVASPPSRDPLVLEDDHASSSEVPSSPSSMSIEETSSFASANASLRSSTADLEALQSQAFSGSLQMPVSGVVPGSPTAMSETFSFASVSGRSPGSNHGGGSDWDGHASDDYHWVSVGQPRRSP